MVQYMKASGNMVKGMDAVNNIGLMGQCMKDIGRIIWQMVKED
jgi:hypothetical protein